MKIGIITFWTSKDNYGQLLQCFALQYYLKKNGHVPFLIKFHPPKSQIKTPKWKRIIKNILVYPIIKELFNYYNNKKKEKLNTLRDFDNFRQNYIIQGNNDYYTIKELRVNPPQNITCLITGSDQVWAMPLKNENNKAYFLDFGNKNIKRIAYAASFGMETYPNEYKNELKELLEKFDAISVRETDGVKICNNLNFEAIEVLDPTLLINKSTYIDSFIQPIKEKEYAFIYHLNILKKNNIRWKELTRYFKANKLLSISTYGSGYFNSGEILNNTKYVYPTIKEWLSYIYYSNLVITTSFHGVVFSIILNKNFIYFPLSGVCGRGNNRVYSLLEKLSLTHKIVDTETSIENFINYSIDWDAVNSKLNFYKNQSKEFINKNLKDEA